MRGSLREALAPTSVPEVLLQASKNEVYMDEPVTVIVQFTVVGGLRDIFHQQEWEKAYDLRDSVLRVTYTVGLYRLTAGVLRRRILKPLKFGRRVTLYWSHNPDLPYRIWAMIVNEDRVPALPHTEAEAVQLFLDVRKNFELLGADFGRGRHRIIARITVKWGRHTYIEAGSAEAASRPLTITVK